MAGQAVLYDTTTVTQAADAQLEDETSVMGRGALLLGLRVLRSAWALGLWAGGGVQYEEHDTVSFADDTTVLRDEAPVTALGQVRVRVQWTAWPGIVPCCVVHGS